jgi:hypothetical protein
MTVPRPERASAPKALTIGERQRMILRRARLVIEVKQADAAHQLNAATLPVSPLLRSSWGQLKLSNNGRWRAEDWEPSSAG